MKEGFKIKKKYFAINVSDLKFTGLSKFLNICLCDQAIPWKLLPFFSQQTCDKCPKHLLAKQSQLVLCSGLASFKSSMCQLQMWVQI